MKVIDEIYTIEFSQIELNTIINIIGGSYELHRIAECAKGPVMEDSKDVDAFYKKLACFER